MAFTTAELYKDYLKSSGVTTDTRQIKDNSIFFALRGENFNGNAFAGEAISKGARLAIIDDEAYAETGKTYLVKNSLETLQSLATHHRQQLNIPVIGLTGTNGKTTTKELAQRVLSQKYKVHATTGNLNNHIGVPLTILGIEAEDQMAVIEMGANHKGEIAQLCRIANPTHGLITNIGKAHLEGFGGYEGVISAKKELYEYLLRKNGKAFVNADNKLLMDLSSKLERTTYGLDAFAKQHAEIISSIPFLQLLWDFVKIATHLFGTYNFENVMAAISIGMAFDVDKNDIVKAISTYQPSNNRSQLLKTDSNTIYLDAYNANPSSMLASIQNFRLQEASKKVLILGDMLELGKDSQAEHTFILDEVRNKFDLVLLVGPEFMASGTDEFICFENTEAAGQWLRENPVKDAHILVKGSRGIALERLLDTL